MKADIMIVRQTTTTILFVQLIILFLSRHVASISLSQFQQIQGFSNSCENVWQEDIPGCTKTDFSTSNHCSRNCLAGVNIINAEVLVACADALVNSNTLLGEFLAGFGVSALCGSSDTETATIADSTTATATAVKTSATSTSLTSVQSTTATTTAVQETTTQPSILSTTASATTSIPSSVTTSSPSASSITDLTLSITGTTTTSTTSSVSSITTSVKSTSSSSSSTEAKGFGGVGDAFDILGGESAGSRSAYVSWEVMTLMIVLVTAIASGIW